MVQLYNNLGFNSNPFSRLSAEEEITYLKNIYVKPRYFDTLLDDIKDGNSRLIFGKRGIGKSSLIYELDRILKMERAFSISINSYDSIPLTENTGHFLHRINEELVTKVAIYITKYSHLLKKLDKHQKVKLAFFIQEFFTPVTTEEYEKYINEVTGFKTKNIFKKIYNSIFYKPLNIAANAGVEIIGSAVSKSLGLDKPDTVKQFKEYFPSIPLKQYNKSIKQEDLVKNIKLLKAFHNEIIKIIGDLGFKSIIVLFDRIDEIPRLGGRIDKISSFLEGILNDTTILHNPKISLVFSLWDQVRENLSSSGIRFDKFRPISISWTFDELKLIAEKRLKYFSKNSNQPVKITDLFPNENATFYALDLSYRSPRDFIRLLSHIYDEQANADSTARTFSRKTINRGKLKYVRNYDYNSVIPSGKGKENIKTNINRLLKIGRKKFKIKDMIKILKISHVTAISYIKILKNLGLVVELEEKVDNAKVYKITDPKINFIIFKGFSSLEEIYY